jgi:hypothetical protein
MGKIMTYQRENQRIPATEILQMIADGHEIKLIKCTVSGDLDVNRFLVKDENFNTSGLDIDIKAEKTTIVFPQAMEFNSCIFEDKVFFAPPWEQPVLLEVIFKSDIIFNMSVFREQSRFSKATFCGTAGFDGCTFDRISVFRDVLFKTRAMFRTVLFNGYGLFNGAVFSEEASFTNTCFGKGGNFTNVRFQGKSDFSGVYAKSKSVPVYESVFFARHRFGDDETFWRFIKQASQEAGYYQLTGESFFNERCAHLCRKFYGPDYEDLSLPKKIGRLIWGIRLLPELIFGRVLFGYGERPIRVLAAGAIIILVCAFYYAGNKAAVLSRGDPIIYNLDFMDGLYFSTITFTTLGFGDLYPAPDHLPTRCVAMIEALSGACLMALFVVGLSKRYSRG